MSDRVQRRVLHDQLLLLDIDSRLTGTVDGWLPAAADRPESPGAPQVRVFVHLAAPLGVESPPVAPSLRWGSIGLWLQADRGYCALASTERDVAGMLDLDVRQATLVANGRDGVAKRLQDALTVSCAVLLGKVGRALVRAPAVLSPSGTAWLVVGPEDTGLVTAAVRLGSAGWRCLGAQYAVLGRSPDDGGPMRVEGWSCGDSGKGGVALPAAGIFPLGGAMLLRAEPDRPTRLVDVPSTDLLTLLRPTSPWLRFDAVASRGTIRSLQDGITVRAAELRVGLDCYADACILADVLTPLC